MWPWCVFLQELEEGCTYIKNASSIIILRAEQASALLLREEAQMRVKVQGEGVPGSADPEESAGDTSAVYCTAEVGAPTVSTKRIEASSCTDNAEDLGLLETTAARQAAA